MIKFNRYAVLALGASLLTSLSAFARAGGDCMASATALKASQTAVLVNEYDPELKEYWDYGCHYYKVTLNKGKAYTIWISGDKAQEIDLLVDTDWEDESAPLAMFDYDEKGDGATKIAYLYADSWDEEDPARGTYYVQLSGEIGAATTLQFVEGIKSFVQEGEEGNPRRLTMTDVQQKDVKNLIEGEYYYVASLKAGRKYCIRTTSGTKGLPLSLFVDSTAFWEEDPDYTNDVNNAAILVYPDSDIDFNFSVYGFNGASAEAFVVKYKSYPGRLPEDHCTWDGSNQLTKENGFSVSMVPGRIIGDKRFYDPVIDESLARIYLAADQRMVFETSGATGGVEMRVYDAAGAVLASNTSLGKGSRDCRAAIQAEAAGWYYVGVCNPELQYWEATPKGPVITLNARDAGDFTDFDEFDPADDEWTGATLISALPASGSSEVRLGINLGSHTLSGGDWYDWLAIPCRKDTTYALKANFDSDSQTDLHLFAKVYRMVNGVLTRYSDVRGNLTPYEADEGTSPLIFTADCNGMFYIRVNVSEGVGLDYPSVCYCAVAYLDAKTPLGLVSGKALGLSGRWYLTDDSSATYPSEAVVAVPEGTKNIRFVAEDPENFVTPAKATAKVLPWIASSNVATVVGRYVDVHDPADNVQSGFVKIYPSHDGVVARRTLWAADDPCDWFRFTAAAGTYYTFELVDRWEESGLTDGGDAVMTIIPQAGGDPVVVKATECAKRAFAPGNYYIRVEHADSSEPKDGCYVLSAKSVKLGTLSFAASTVTVANDAGYVELTVKRSASEGRVRLNYATVAGTALPGKAYYPVSGVLEWADGDMSPKTVRVRLIPDLVQRYGKQDRFSVKVWPMSEDSLADDEYAAIISGSDTATVKLNRTTPANPGAVELVSQRSACGGQTYRAVFRRTGGTDGSIAVKVKTQSSTALIGTTEGDGSDLKYVKEVLTWKNGENGDKVIEVPIWATDWTGDPKQFRFKLATLATGTYVGNLVPQLPESKIYIPIENALQPGSVILKEPANREVAPGGTMRAVFSRVGGSSGSIAVKVKTQSSTALIGTTEGDGSDLKYVKEVLEWADGDSADKVLEVPIWAVDTWRATKQFRFKLATLATGAYAGNLVPKLPETKIYISIVSPLVPAGAVGGPATSVVGGRNADGTLIVPGKKIELVQGVNAWLTFGSTNKTAAASCALVDGELPPGLVLTGNKLRVNGVPTVPGDYSALIQAQGAGKKGDGVWLDFHVAPAETAFGSFSGVLTGDALVLADGATRLGSFTFSAASDGVQSAKVKVGASTYAFTKKNGYDLVVDRDDSRPGQTMRLVTELTQNVPVDGLVYTNRLVITVGAGALTNAVAIGESAGSVALELNVLGTSVGVQEAVAYEGELFRNCSDSEDFVRAMSAFAGYYTVALVPFGVTPSMGVPCGNGYLTLTVDEAGLVQCAGLMANGKSISLSARASLAGDLSDPAACSLRVPIFQKATAEKLSYCFGGVLKIDWNAVTEGGVEYPASTVDSRSGLAWFADGASSSADGFGFGMTIRPTGGWYNTVFNLQTYYLNRDFTVEAEPVDGLPKELLPAGCAYSADTMPHGVTTLLDVNAFVPADRILVYRTDRPDLFDLAKSVNPWKVKTTFTRETGILTGTFKAWSDGSVQSQFATYSHYGILPMYRDPYSPLEETVLTAGFYLMPVTGSWSSSLPFDIRCVEYESRDWSEVAVPEAE